MHLTLRLRITLLAASLVAVVLLATGALLVSAQHRLLEGAIDEAIAERSDELARALVGASTWPPDLSSDADEDIDWQVAAPDGRIVAQGRALRLREPFPSEELQGPDAQTRTASEPPLDEDAFPYRISSRLLDGGPEPVILHVAADLEDVLASTATLTRLLAVAIPLVVSVIAVLAWWLVGRTLRPVEAIREHVSRIGGSNLERRVPVPDGDDEIARLARTMNAMLVRLEEATRRQGRFVADASHELRTPLTRLRSRLELALTQQDDTDRETLLRAAIDETAGLGALVDDLLDLARADAGAGEGPTMVGARREPLDLDDIVLSEAMRIRERGRVRVVVSGVSAAAVDGDAQALRRAVRNLLDNAERHARATVALSLREEGGRARLVVADDGPGIPAEDRERVFERFTRLDDARGREAGGTGLGLAITRQIALAHGGDVRVEDSTSQEGGGPTGARLLLELPLAPG